MTSEAKAGAAVAACPAVSGAGAAQKTSLSTAEAVVRLLELNGINTVFGLPGIQNDHLMDAFYAARAKIRFVHTRHEQGAAYMALGAALASGKPSAYAVVPGPGFLNTTAALSTAYAANAPVLALAGQIPSHAIGRELGYLHEIPDQLGIMERLTKWAGRIGSPEQAPALVTEAFRQMLQGRTRPVALECSIDVWGRRAEVELPAAISVSTPEIDEDAVAQAAALLAAAERPLIVVGGGALRASEEIKELAELAQAPVVAYRMGRGVLDSRHPLSVTVPLGHQLWRDADVVVAVGSRLQMQLMGWGRDEKLKVIRIDIDPAEMNKIQPPAVGIVGDAAPAVRKLVDGLARRNRKRASRTEEILGLKAEFAKKMAGLQPQLDFLSAIRDVLPEDGIFVDELTQPGYVSRIAFPVYRPRTYLSSSYQGTLGWAVPAAIGAKAARPDVPVVAISGDGGFMFNVQELATAVQHGINIVIVLFNDGAFGNVRRIQSESYGNRLIACDLANPDFLKLAESFGVFAQRVGNAAELRPALRKAFAAQKPALIEVPVGPMPSPWPFLMLPKVRTTKS